jgi:hypothetical protein
MYLVPTSEIYKYVWKKENFSRLRPFKFGDFDIQEKVFQMIIDLTYKNSKLFNGF